MKTVLFLFILSTSFVFNNLFAEQQEFSIGNAKVKCLVFSPTLKDKSIPGLFIFIGPGSGEARLAPIAFDTAKNFCEKQGLFLVTPISDDTKGFIDGKNKIVIDLANALIKEGKVSAKNILIGGISRGGKAALQIAGSGDLSIGGVVAVPGILEEALEKTKGFKDMHVYLRIGSKDNLADVLLKQTKDDLESYGAIVDSKLVENGEHVFKINWDEITKWKEAINKVKN